MISIISKRHITKFYLSIILGSIFYFGLASFFIYDYLKIQESLEYRKNENLMPIFSVVLFALGIYTIYKYYKNSPIVKIDKTFISFKSEIYPISEIIDIQLTGKQNFNYVISFPMEATTILFKNGNSKYFFDSMYSNSWELKTFLNQTFFENGKFEKFCIHKIDPNELNRDYYDTFKNNQFTSFRGIMLYGMLIFFAQMILSKPQEKIWPYLFIIFFCLVYFIFFSFQLNYFQVSKNYFLVRNHNFLWKKKAYRISDIQEITFETFGKMPNCLRIITKDYKTKLFAAGSLRDKTWLALKEKLESQNISVRNELII